MTAKLTKPAAGKPTSALSKMPWVIDTVVFASLVAATCVLYAGDLRLGFFQLDDQEYVVNNPWIREVSGVNLWHILSEHYFANYSPVHLLTYMLDHAVAGLNPYAFHLSNNIWGGVAAGFVYLLCLKLLGRRLIALAAAALFVVHPAHVEAVAWISSRKDLVATAFAVSAALAYFRYRDLGLRSKVWYWISVILFALAIAAKQSVVVLPGILFLFDYFVEKRRGTQIWTDKLPYVIVAAFFALRTFGAQPPTGYKLDLPTIGYSFAQSLWLLTGFGDYVLYRMRPDPLTAYWAKIVYGTIPFAILALPFALHRWVQPLAIVSMYWIVLGLVPPQALSLVHPVCDRYLFFPSVGLVLLIGWATEFGVRRWGSRAAVASGIALVVFTVIWARSSYAYLQEWRDPRSAWYAATKKSSDVDTFFNLGAHYHNAAIALDGTIRTGAAVPDDVRRLAETMWADDPRLPALLAEWQPGPENRPVTREFQKHLYDLGWNEYEEAVPRRGGRIMPNLYFRRGAILTERGNFDAARKEFQFAYELSQRHTYYLVRQELTVRYYYALGLVEWKAGSHEAALRWLRKAQDEQIRLGRTWVPELAQYCTQLEGIIRARTPQQSSPAN